MFLKHNYGVGYQMTLVKAAVSVCVYCVRVCLVMPLSCSCEVMNYGAVLFTQLLSDLTF